MSEYKKYYSTEKQIQENREANRTQRARDKAAQVGIDNRIISSYFLCANCKQPNNQAGIWDTCKLCTGVAIDKHLGRMITSLSHTISVQPDWCRTLPLQQQSVLLLAARGPDGISKVHPCKRVQRAYRACVLHAAYEGGLMEWGQGNLSNTFMGLDEFANDNIWKQIVDDFFLTADELPHHFLMHLLHGVEILGYKHPDERFRNRWIRFYLRGVKEFHMLPESEIEMDQRLNDWNREHWNES